MVTVRQKERLTVESLFGKTVKNNYDTVIKMIVKEWRRCIVLFLADFTLSSYLFEPLQLRRNFLIPITPWNSVDGFRPHAKQILQYIFISS